jgi:hypothetical protein
MRIGTREAAILAVAAIALVAIVALVLRPPGGAAGATGQPSLEPTTAPAGTPAATPVVSREPTLAPTTRATASSTPEPATETLVGAGDIADCDSDLDTQTAALVAAVPGTVFTLGDNAYEDGKRSEFEDCYEPTWGPFKDRTRPAPGNHDYHTAGAAGYFEYFGDRAGPAGRGYYAYDSGAWRIYSLNSMCGEIGGCGAGSAELTWLKADLAANARACSLAYWHHPRYSSGEHGNNASMDDIWDILVDAGVELVLAGHDHSYERFAPMNKAGNLAPDKGITSFVVGTGGRDFYAFDKILPTSRARATGVAGVIELTLKPGSWSTRFIPVPGETFTDRAQDVCH